MQKTDFRFEAVVHDDASTDNSAQIIKEYAEKYPDIIKPIFETENQYSKHDGSLRHIFNSACHGKYIALCEGDDYWTDPYKLQKQISFLENNPEYGVAYSSYETVDLVGNKIIYPPSKIYLSRSRSGDIFLDLLKGNFPQTLTVVYRKDAFDDSLCPPYSYDYTLFLNLSLNTKFYFFPDILGCYRINPNGMMQTNALAYVDTVRIQLFFLKEYFQHKEYRRPIPEDRKIVSFMVECCCGFHYYIKYKDLFWAIIKSRPYLILKLPRGLFEARKRHKRSLSKNQ
ncbi:MAG: glycosyltransferase [Bacteroidales bacterium]|nr:glycosyltransferase [Bacteroidales bacterium]